MITETARQDRRTRPAGQAGLTLIELMVALLIGLLITGAAIQIFLSNKQAYRMTEAVARIQENGRFAMQFLAKDIRAADAWGCGGREVDMRSLLNNDPDLDFEGDPITGQEAGAAGNSQTDTITVRGSTGRNMATLTGPLATPASDVGIPVGTRVEVGDLMLISDCDRADVFEVTGPADPGGAGSIEHAAAGANPGNATGSFSQAYTADATVTPALHVQYRTADRDGRPTLLRVFNGTTQELVSGVDDLAIEYGVDRNGNRAANFYVPADEVPDWDDVVSVRIQVVMRSEEDQLTTDEQQYEFDGNDVTAPDRRLYKVFSSVVTLRNRAR